MKRQTLVMAVLAASVALSGCALTTDRIQLQYAQQQGVSRIPGAGEVSVNVKVSDQRQDKTRVSSKKNGFGMEMAPIVPMVEVTDTVRNAMEQELQARGFKLGSQAAQVQIAADLTRFYNDYKTGFFAGDAVADLNLYVAVKPKQGGPAYSRHIVAQGVEPNIQLASGENARLALNRALENGMKLLFDDREFVDALMAAAPQKSAASR